MKTTKYPLPKALQETWDWKEACWREVDGLDLKTAIRQSLKNANISARSMGFTPVNRKLAETARQ